MQLRRGSAKLRAMNHRADIPHPALPRRLAALVYDTLLVLPIIMLSVFLGMLVRSFLPMALPVDGSQSAALHPVLVQGIAIVTVTGFFCWFWLRGGQTLGMQAWRIKLVNFEGEAPTPRQAIVRALSALLSAACLGLGYWWCLVDSRQRYWHDYLSGTELILLPKS